MTWNVRYSFKSLKGSIAVRTNDAALHCARGLLAIGCDALEISGEDVSSGKVKTSYKRRVKANRTLTTEMTVPAP